jgi:predicted ATPase
VLRQESELIRVGGSDVIVPRNSTVPGFALYFDTAVATGLAADQMSEGTLLLLGLLTALHDPFEADVVLLDDLDRGLHPRAQRNLIELIQALQTTWPELQVIATTHSPYLLDAIEPSQVLLTSLDDTGKVHCCALSNHPEIHRWADTMSTGELWSMVGEDWVRSAQVEAGR